LFIENQKLFERYLIRERIAGAGSISLILLSLQHMSP
jgi:hypothetical protein